MQYTGQILDENMKLMQYVNVTALGGNVSTQTDADGKYKINLPGPKTELKFTYVGYDYDTVTADYFDKNSYLQLYPNAEVLPEVVVIAPKSVKDSDNTIWYILAIAAAILVAKKVYTKKAVGLKKPTKQIYKKSVKVLM